MARVIRTLLIEEGRAEGKDLSGRQKAAILAITLGQSATARVVKHLNDYEIEDIAQAISELKTVTSEQEREVVEEIEQLLVAGHYVSMGGIDFARGALEKALGPQRAQQMLDRVTASTTVGFYLLKNIAPNHLAPFIGKEHPQTIALVLSQLEPAQAAGVLNILPDELASEVTYRVATMENISPQVLREIEESLAMELQAILTGQITDIGGVKKVAEILNVTGPTTEKVILEKLDERDPEMAEEIRNEMFTFDDIARLTDREIQRLLREVDKKDLAVSLKGARPEMQDRILSNVSEEVRAQVKELMEFSGPIRLSDVEEVQLRIVQMVRQLEEAGQVTVVRGESKDVFV
ncbi:MAG: flagellar motor switch protein FliG [Candidatus Handelsmanbacteria bacterium RIFCSPLOWO2_12_FULL_64_10]|uniref:Flagellar motor switch protein FliG n=1 Tax=Handelsmanbacteria sp. (strain RIFCSPLOWO2_12_FULL_64_10) TaxID=1817868 RepID=A0A1F6CYT5_HANXR|nr:MAG: flagellar motor switch protein FliG [Candidatus Handelsmanbacteria bacterium RIFCSPLOWO2_12_FULL_64_10]